MINDGDRSVECGNHGTQLEDLVVGARNGWSELTGNLSIEMFAVERAQARAY